MGALLRSSHPHQQFRCKSQGPTGIAQGLGRPLLELVLRRRRARQVQRKDHLALGRDPEEAGQKGRPQGSKQKF